MQILMYLIHKVVLFCNLNLQQQLVVCTKYVLKKHCIPIKKLRLYKFSHDVDQRQSLSKYMILNSHQQHMFR